ncbi:hypothetical protein F383_26110 [Gossypium arboreum]|uniref:Uncharacterized protein n=1 Tax=Gossypium arboreum TaxID=29729 RepID=A0A0B0PBK5_GOSAR|nr:hypothetical protein F383_26110 [Gossypium arboreum]
MRYFVYRYCYYYFYCYPHGVFRFRPMKHCILSPMCGLDPCIRPG